jgi:hypothetical protein
MASPTLELLLSISYHPRCHPQEVLHHPMLPTISHLLQDLYDLLFGYADSDWAMDIRHRRSISGIIMMLAGGAIAWKCRVQVTILLSTTESEVLSASDAGHLALFLRSVLRC